MINNNDGLKYFIYQITKNTKSYLILPEDIRKLIWDFANEFPFIKCYICNVYLLKLSVNINNRKLISSDLYTTFNGNIKCNNCYID